MFERAPLPRRQFTLFARQKSPYIFATTVKLALNTLLFFLFAIPATAQFQSAFVFASDPKGVAVYTRNDATGVLTAVPGSPFPSKEAVTSMLLDFKGRYLFTANSNTNKISMFTIDPDTGVLQEVPNSPFASISTDIPVFLAPEQSGQTLYVINFYGSSTSVSAIESFQIDSVNLALVPSSSPAVDLPGLFVAGANHPSGKSFYAYANDMSQADLNAALFLVFNSSNGTFTVANTGLARIAASCLTMAPQGQYVVTGSGISGQGTLNSYALNTDGTLSNLSTSVSLDLSQKPTSVSLDTLGKFLYVTLGTQPSTVHLYSPKTLQELASSPLPSSFTSTSSWLVDPSAPLIFADQVYQVSPANGTLSSIFSPNTLTPPAVFTLPPGSQPIEGPVAQLSASSLSFGSLSVGLTSSAQTLTITNTGGQNLSLNTLVIGGTNAGDFAEQSDSCHVPNVLTPNQSCSALITFTPSATGALTASLTITDNAAPSTESVSLSGTGLPQAPAVTLVPGTLTFGTSAAPISQGTSTSSNVTVTNSGTAPLHISNIALAGANSGDFSFSSTACSLAIAVNANCTIAVTFLPQAAGLRSATITLTDDAPDSPQVLQINGYGASQPGPAISLAPSALTFGTAAAPIAQGTSTSSNLTVSNSGNAALHISNIAIAGSNSSDFSFSAPNCNGAIAANASCTISVTFVPQATGQRYATITLSDDAPGSSQTIQLSGYAGVDFRVGPASSGQTTATVAAGGTATYQLQITPGVGYSGNVSLTCTGAPQAATCQMPTNVAISNGAAAPFNVTVTTTAKSVLPFAPNTPTPPQFLFQIWFQIAALLAALCAFLIFLLTDRFEAKESPSTRRFAVVSSLAALALFCVTSLTGCGGGTPFSASTTPPPPTIFTPSGTSTLTVTATPAPQNGKQLAAQTIQLTLTVN